MLWEGIVWFGVLGSLEVLDERGAPVDVGGAQPRTLLAALLLARSRVVAVDWLIECVWGGDAPPSAPGTLQSYVSRLRRVVEPRRDARAPARVLVSEPPGYRLDVPADRVDFRRFERLADEGRALLDAGDPAAARDVLVDAVGLWRGPALAEFADAEFARGKAVRLEERRLATIEDRIDAELRLGRHTAVIGDLTELVAGHPLREGLRAHLAIALYRAGRQAKALRVIDEARRRLREELGVDLGPDLRDLEVRILDQDPSLAVADRPAGPPAGPAPMPSRAPAPASSPAPPAPEPTQPPPAPAPAPAQPSAPAPTRPPAPAAPDPASALVGRDAERSQLLDALAEAAAGQPRFVLVEGEPGIGKTRLLEELAWSAAAAGALVLWGRCHEGEGAPAFWPWLPVLRDLLAALPVADRDVLLAGELGRLVGPSGAPEAPTGGAGQPPNLGGVGRFPLFEAVTDALQRSSARYPVVVLLDDLQWADIASLELLGFLAQRLGGGRVLAVGSIRELEVGRNDAVVGAVSTVMRRPGTRRVHLHGVDRAATAVLVRRALGAAAPAATVEAIHARSDGNPFFVGELARLVSSEPSAAAIPAGVREVVRRRLAQLPERTVELLDVAAVVGRDVELRVLARASGLSVDRCLEDLEAAVTTRLLGNAPDRPGTFRFAHALVREAVLDELSPLRRARLHQRVADAIVDTAGDSDDAAEIVAAHLWSAAPLGEERRAAEALERAADVATRRYAYEAADDLLERAAHLRRSAGSAPDDVAAELSVLTRLASVRRVLHGYRGGWDRAPLERAKELAQRSGRDDLLLAFLWAEWAGAATCCDFEVAIPMAEELRRVGEASDDPDVRSMGDHGWAVQCWHLGNITDAVTYSRRASSRIKGNLEALQESGPLVKAFTLVFGAMAGELEDPVRPFEELARAHPDPFAQIIVYSCGAYAAVAVGEFVVGERLARRATVPDPNRVVAFFSNGNDMYLADSLAGLGRADEALALYDRALPAYLATGARTIVPFHLAHRALAFVGAQRGDEAIGTLAEAWRMVEEHGEKSGVPTVLLAEALVHHALGEPADEVARRLEKARETARGQGAHGVASHVERRAADLGIALD